VQRQGFRGRSPRAGAFIQPARAGEGGEESVLSAFRSISMDGMLHNSPALQFALLSRRPADPSESPHSQEGTMPHGARTSLAILILALGTGGASAEPAAGSSWTDPPARKPAAETSRPIADQKAAAPAAAPATPAAASQAVRPPPAARKAVAARRIPERTVSRSAPRPAKRLAAAPRRAHVAATPPRTLRNPRFVAIAPPPPQSDRYLRDRPYGYGYGSGYGANYADDRLERLRAAEAAGYLVVRGRTVQFPDGRTLRVYRPVDSGEPF
jgi:hypothetical protein